MKKVINAISKYRSKEIDFHELKGWIIPCAEALESKLGYERRDFLNDLDNWFEYIEFAYRPEDRRELTLSLVTFIEKVITKKTGPILLPKEEQVVKEQIMKNNS